LILILQEFQKFRIRFEQVENANYRHKCFFNGLWHCVRVEPDCPKGFPAHGDGEMGFLLRIAFWFSLVLLLIPFDMGNEQPGTERVGPIETFLAAREAVVDFSGICERKPEVCEVGKSAMNTVGVRAREAARIAYEMLDENFGETDKATLTGTIPRPAETVPPAVKPTPAAPKS
jgi:hypothetical protein